MSYLKASDIARELGVSRSAAYEIMKEMPRLVRRGIVRVSSEAFKRWCDRHTTGPTTIEIKKDAHAVRFAVRAERRRGSGPDVSDGSELRIRSIKPRTTPRTPELQRPSMRASKTLPLNQENDLEVRRLGRPAAAARRHRSTDR